MLLSGTCMEHSCQLELVASRLSKLWAALTLVNMLCAAFPRL